MTNAVRVIAGVFGACLIVIGLAGVATGGWADGVYNIVPRNIKKITVVLERTRYRSEAAERTDAAPGPGGGEPSVPQAPFRPTDEVFVDPTSGHRLRVYLNPATGERRYHAEGER